MTAQGWFSPFTLDTDIYFSQSSFKMPPNKTFSNWQNMNNEKLQVKADTF